MDPSLAYIGNASVFDFGGYSFMGGLVSKKKRSSVRCLSPLGGNVCLAEYLLERTNIDAHPCLAHGRLDRSVRAIVISSILATDCSFQGYMGARSLQPRVELAS